LPISAARVVLTTRHDGQPRPGQILLTVIRAGSYQDGIAHWILFCAAAEIFVPPAAQWTFNFYRVVHGRKHFINRCNYLATIINPTWGVRDDIIHGKMLPGLQS
jgi:hypothetical protein